MIAIIESLPGYEKLQSAAQVEKATAELTKLVLDAVKSGGKKKVKIELEIEVCGVLVLWSKCHRCFPTATWQGSI